MLGKGLESLIPPQNGDAAAVNNDVLAPQEPPRAPMDGVGHHDHTEPGPPSASPADSGPQILSFEFTQPNFSDENLGGQAPLEATRVRGAPLPPARQAASDFATPAVAPRGVSEEVAIPPAHEEKKDVSREQPHDYIFHIEVSKIKPNPNQPRKNFDESALRELAKSIREFGFLQPLIVTRKEKETDEGVDVEYELIAGERRLLAAKMLGLEHAPAIVRNTNLEREKLEIAIIENVQREDLNAIERARAFQRLQEEFRLTQREIASKLGKSRETVANTVRLLDLPVYIQEVLEKGQITESHGRFLLAINDPAAQKKLFEDILSQGLTTRDLRHRVSEAKPKANRPENEQDPEIKMFEEKLTAELGTPVKIEKGANTGKITITFYSDEELQQIVGRFGGAE